MTPIEQLFLQEWTACTGNERSNYLFQQYSIKRYRVDFAHLLSRTVIELDGHASHSSPKAIAYDRKREREIERKGWRVIRFGGYEVFTDVKGCVEEVREIIARRVKQISKYTPLTSSSPSGIPYHPGEQVEHLLPNGVIRRGTILQYVVMEYVYIQFDSHEVCKLSLLHANLVKINGGEVMEDSERKDGVLVSADAPS